MSSSSRSRARTPGVKRALVDEIWEITRREVDDNLAKKMRLIINIKDEIERRRELNKLSSARHREVQSQYLINLTGEYTALKQENAALVEENKRLTQHVEELYGAIEALTEPSNARRAFSYVAPPATTAAFSLPLSPVSTSYGNESATFTLSREKGRDAFADAVDDDLVFALPPLRPRGTDELVTASVRELIEAQ